MSEATCKRKTIPELQAMKARGEKIAVLTAYDFPFARLMDQAGIDIVLVGDSAGVVVAGYETTLPVTMEEMLYHTRAVVRGVSQALVVADMPFLSYQVDLSEARRNAGLLIKEGGRRRSSWRAECTSPKRSAPSSPWTCRWSAISA